MLLLGVAACDPGAVIEPVAEKLPPAEPGIRLPFPAPESDGMFPLIAWDSNSQSIVLPDTPNSIPATLVRFALESGEAVPLETLTDPVQVLGGAGGAFFYTQSLSKSDVLTRVGGEVVTPVTAVQFAVSRNGRWIVVRDSGWDVIDLTTGERRPVPAIPELRYPLAIDNDGTQIAFGMVGQLSELELSVTLADMTAGTTRTIATPGERLLAVEFIGNRLMLLGFETGFTAGMTEMLFVTRTDLPNSTRVIGRVQAASRGDFVGVCAAWSPDAGYGVGIIQVRPPTQGRARHSIVKLDSAAHVIGTADLLAPTDCTLSPDGKWFIYGNTTGYLSAGDLYLKPVR